MDIGMLAEASFVFLEGHGFNFVEIHNVVKFLANGLCKSDICGSFGDTIFMHVAT
jgi:hypothetical protein